jgi:hypothetical protein
MNCGNLLSVGLSIVAVGCGDSDLDTIQVFHRFSTSTPLDLVTIWFGG